MTKYLVRSSIVMMTLILGVVSAVSQAFTFVDFSSSNLTGRVIGTNAQSLNGARSGSVVAGAYMVVSTYFTTANPLNIANTTVLIDGFPATIIDLGANSYQARVQMPGDNGTNRQLSVEVSNRDDGVTTAGIIPASTTVAGKSVYYITQSNTYSQFATRCVSGDVEGILPISNGIYSGTIIPVGRMKVYCHNVLTQLLLTGTSFSGAAQTVPAIPGSRSYINPTFQPLALPGDLWSYYIEPAFGGFGFSTGSFNTALVPDGIYTARFIIMSNAGFPLFPNSPRLVLRDMIFDNTPPVLEVLASTGTDTSRQMNFSGSDNRSPTVLSGRDRINRVYTNVAGSVCADSPVVDTASDTMSHTVSLAGLTPGTQYCLRAIGTDKAGNSTILDTLYTTDVALTTGSIVFNPLINTALNTLFTSNTVTYTGTLPLTISGISNGSYQIAGCSNTAYNTSGFVTGTGTLGQDCQITLQTTSSTINSTPVAVTVSFVEIPSASWTVTTLAAASSGGGSSSAGGGGGGGSVRLNKDDCPSGDFSPSYYDKTCGNPNTGEVIPTGDSPSEKLTSIINQFQNISDICTKDNPEFLGFTQFSDTIGHRNESAINTLVSYCAVIGRPNGNFEPDSPPYMAVTYGEAVKIVTNVVRTSNLQRVINITKDSQSAALSRYPSLRAGTWYNYYINEAINLGVMRDLERPTANGTFTLPNMDAPITRTQLVQIIANAATVQGLRDVTIQFTPRDTVSRADVAETVVRIFGLQNNDAFLNNNSKNLELLGLINNRLKTLSVQEQQQFVATLKTVFARASSRLFIDLNLNKAALIKVLNQL